MGALRRALIAHRLICRTLVVRAAKVTTPEFEVPVTSLAAGLSSTWAPDAKAALDTTIARLLELREQGASEEQLQAEVETTLQGGLASLGPKRAVSMAPKMRAAMEAVYGLGKDEILGPMGKVKGEFTVQDTDAIAGLNRLGLLWVGGSYGDALPTSDLTQAIADGLKAGEGRKALGARLKAAAGNSIQRGEVYWEGLAATMATRARSFGALEGMSESGVVTYEYVNPLDERTSSVCRHLDGTRFQVKEARALRDRLLKAETPDEWRSIAPWPRNRDVQDEFGKTLPAETLAKRGIMLPPLHMHCRSSVQLVFADLADLDAGGFSDDPFPDFDESTPEPEPVAPAPAPAPKPPRKPRAPRNPRPEPAVPVVVEDPWVAARHRLVMAEKAARDAGLEPHDWSSKAGKYKTKAKTRREKLELLQRATDMDYMGAAQHDALVGLFGGVAPDPKQIAEEIRLLDEVTAAYNAAVRHPNAPASWLKAEHERWVDAAAETLKAGGRPGKPKKMSAADIKRAKEHLRGALQTLGPDYLRLFVSEGQEVLTSPNARAYSQDGSILLNHQDAMGPPPAMTGHAWGTAAHEITHSVDRILGGRVGKPWEARPGWENAPAVWQRNFKDPFDAVRERNQLQSLDGDGYAWRGQWVKPYEGRIYTDLLVPGTQRPDVSKLTAEDDRTGGPVEFQAMCASFRGGASFALRNPDYRSRIGMAASKVGSMQVDKTSVLELLLGAEEGGQGYNSTWELAQAERKYGRNYLLAWEAEHRDGERTAAAVADQLKFRDDRDVVGTAHFWARRTGVDVQRLIGKDGLWAHRLKAPIPPGMLDELAATEPKVRESDPGWTVAKWAPQEEREKLIKWSQGKR